MFFTVISVLFFILCAFLGHREALSGSALRAGKNASTRAILFLTVLAISLRIVLAVSSPAKDESGIGAIAA